MSAFSEIPILDLSLADNPATKPELLNQLRHALLEVGFLYIKNYGIPADLTQQVIEQGKALFDIPEEEKFKIEMKNSPHFLGYSRLANEITKEAIDWREQIDLATELPAPGGSEPRYRWLRGPNLWPSEEVLPKFREVYTEYINRMAKVSTNFTSLVAESLGLEPTAFDKYFDPDQQHKLKIVKYPDLGELGASGTGQGVGPHKDSMLTSYLLQASDHKGLQAQNSEGEWIDCPPIDGTLVVVIGQGLEALTRGVCVSTSHQVISPPAGSGARYSVPFFQGVSYDAKFGEMDLPESVLKLKNELRQNKDNIEMTFRHDMFDHIGEATLLNRVKSHKDVAERWYPDLIEVVTAKKEELRGKLTTSAVPLAVN
ncbi:hypothetical protein BZA70DRAFT_275208 [Myxozyma melibiosi]|uniref:Fe2OG dioxygenase domain-containing protein n=1 Tax=Myxozyma melibiosi TaxID=54550 RepID=A0ABR1FAI1_9ASCO